MSSKKFLIIPIAIVFLLLVAVLFACVPQTGGGGGGGQASPSVANMRLERVGTDRVPEFGQILAVSTNIGVGGVRTTEGLAVFLYLHNQSNLEIVSFRINGVLQEQFLTTGSTLRVNFFEAIVPSEHDGEDFVIEITHIMYRRGQTVRPISPLVNNRVTVRLDPTFTLRYVVEANLSATGERLEVVHENVPFMAEITPQMLPMDSHMNRRTGTIYEPVFAKENWAFVGWFTGRNGGGTRVATGGAHIAIDAIFEFFNDTTFYAYFTPLFEYVTKTVGKAYGAVITSLTDVARRADVWPGRTVEPHINGLPIVALADRSMEGFPLINLTLPKFVTEIGRFVFENMNVRVTLNEGLEIIGEGAFRNNLSMQFGGQTFILPSTLRVIEREAFAGVVWNRQAGNPNMPTLVVHRNIEEIGFRAFAGSGFTNVYFEWNSSLTNFSEEAFFNMTNLTTVRTAVSVGAGGIIFNENQNGLKSIPANAFRGSFRLATLELSEGLETIGESAFQALSPANTAINTINFPASIREIGAWAFSNMTSLRVINFAQGSELNRLGDAAFASSAIEFVHFRFMGSAVIGAAPFHLNSALRFVEFDAPIPPVFERNTIDTFLGIPRQAGFLSGQNLNFVRFLVPYGTSDAYREGVYQSSRGLLGTAFSLNFFEKYCTTLAGFGGTAREFTNIYALTGNIRFGYEAVLNDDGRAIGIRLVYIVNPYRAGANFLDVTNVNLNFSLPSDIPRGLERASNFAGIIKIGANVSSHAIRQVNLPTSVVNIESNAFTNSSLLQILNFQDLELLETIGSLAFANTGVTSFTSGSSLREIGANAFSASGELTIVRLILGNDIRVFAEAFSNTAIKTVLISENVQEIGAGAFASNPQLTQVIMNRPTPPTLTGAVGNRPFDVGNITFYLPSPASVNALQNHSDIRWRGYIYAVMTDEQAELFII